MRNPHYYLLKVARFTGWLLAPLMILFIVTGFTLGGELGFRRLMSSDTALWLHRVFEWPFIGVFAVHTAITSYFAFRRWGWIGKRRRRATATAESDAAIPPDEASRGAER
jgi:hypothetical protein